MIQVKICGITNLLDAHFAANEGANAIGFVFYEKSPRFVLPENLKSIIENLPPFTQIVGLFVNHSQREINHILKLVPLNLLQFHGNEPDDFCLSFHRPFIKSVGINTKYDFETACQNYPNAKAILADNPSSFYGGTGQTFDWSLLPKKRSKPLILAGGLNCDNIQIALNEVKPDAVDVSSGVEGINKGKKDHILVKKFINCAKLSID